MRSIYVIFICEKDVYKKNEPIHCFDRYDKKNKINLNDSGYIIYVNGQNRDNTPLGKLMHDFSCKDPNEMYYEVFKKRVKYLKEEAEGQNIMCELVEQYAKKQAKIAAKEAAKIAAKKAAKEAAKKATMKAEAKEKKATTKRMLAMGLTIEQIMQATLLTEEEIKALA